MDPIYRPRHPERTALYRLFEREFDRFMSEYEERFEHQFGVLRPVVSREVHKSWFSPHLPAIA